jgi:hypothetical protein
MVRLIKVVNVVDQVTDMIPLVSNVKNITILLYQLTHKINKVANPVNPSWKDDIKIHVLSKSAFTAGISMIPFLGNLTCLTYYVLNALVKARGMKLRGGPIGYLGEAIRASNWGLKKHNYEVVALYLARNPTRLEEKLRKALVFAAREGNKDIFELILGSRTTWSVNSIIESLRSSTNAEIACIILEKYSSVLTDKQAADILSHFVGCSARNNYDLIELFIQTYPKMDINEMGHSLEKAAGKEGAYNIVELLLKHFPCIKDQYLVAALKKASENEFKDIVKLLFEKASHLLPIQLDQILEQAANNGKNEFMDWLFANYEKYITTTSIGKVLAAATQFEYFGDDDGYLSIVKALMVSKYHDLPGKDLEPALKKAASLNADVFEMYLNTFTQLQPENLQEILNNTIVLHSSLNQGKGVFLNERCKKVFLLIQKKFPQMVAVDLIVS